MPSYAVFRVSEKKYKDIKQLSGYQRHMERLMPVPNSDMAICNQRLIGSGDIVNTVKEYIDGIKLRKNNVIARDLILTASPEFFKNATAVQKEQWVQQNIKWLERNFGSNCVYATLHVDERTPHISALVVPKFCDEKKQRYVLANARYFDGIAKMSAWQDNYASSMQELFKDLNRGLKYSKAKHVQIRQFYSIINAELNDRDLKSICAKAKNSELLEVKIKGLQRTLNVYKDISSKTALEHENQRAEISVCYKTIKELQADKELYKEAVKALSEIHKIPQSSIKSVFEYVKASSAEKSAEMELKK
jgi:hypothetical protein